MTASEEALDLSDFVAAIRDAASSRSGAQLDTSLADIGWADALGVAPRTAVSSLFEEQGAACSTSGALGVLVCSALGAPSAAGTRVVLPRVDASAPAAELVDGTAAVRVHGLVVGRAQADEDLVLVATGADGTTCWASVPAGKLSCREVEGIDPAACLAEVSGELTVDRGAWHSTASPWAEAVALARVAVGHELVGTMAAMLDLARQHALDRVQFGRPIAGFQAVRHRLAESLVAIEVARAALDGAWLDRSPTNSRIAKAACGHSARTVRRHCQQVLAGIGFTTEHDLHRHVRRSILLDGMFGGARSLTAELGGEVLASGELPAPLPL